MKVFFEVVGMPVAQGSKKMVGPYRMVETGKGHADWRNQVTDVAMRHAQHLAEPLDGPLRLRVVFRFPMPSSRRKAVRQAGTAWKVSAPDLDKLVRCVGDALTASALIKDDARFVQVEASKVETTAWTGAVIEVGQMSDYKLNGVQGSAA